MDIGTLLEMGAAPDRVDSRATCPVDTAIAVIAGKWKLHLLRALYLHGPLRYNALLQLAAPIAAKELTRNLRELEYAGLVTRRQQSDMPDGLYALTELGTTLEQTFRALGEFGTAYLLSRRSMQTKPE